MNKLLIASLSIASFFAATSVSAQTYTYEGVSAGGQSDMQVDIVQYVGDDHIGIESAMLVPPPPMPAVLPFRADIQTRETNRQLIERLRREKMQQTQIQVRNTDGIESGTIRIYRAEDGNVVEDRMLTLPSTTRPLPGKPYMFRLPAQAGASSSTSTPRGFMIRAAAASGSRAIFLRETSSSGPMHMFENRLLPMRFESAATGSGDLFFRLQTNETPIEKFMGRIFNIFRRKSHDTQMGVIQNTR